MVSIRIRTRRRRQVRPNSRRSRRQPINKRRFSDVRRIRRRIARKPVRVFSSPVRICSIPIVRSRGSGRIR